MDSDKLTLDWYFKGEEDVRGQIPYDGSIADFVSSEFRRDHLAVEKPSIYDLVDDDGEVLVWLCPNAPQNTENGPYNLLYDYIELFGEYRPEVNRDMTFNPNVAHRLGNFKIEQLSRDGNTLFSKVVFEPSYNGTLPERVNEREIILIYDPKGGFSDPNYDFIFKPLDGHVEIWSPLS